MRAELRRVRRSNARRLVNSLTAIAPSLELPGDEPPRTRAEARRRLREQVWS